jgi:hypothetical protein
MVQSRRSADGGVDQLTDLIGLGDIGGDREHFRALAYQLISQGLDTVDAPSTTMAPRADKCRAVASPSPLLAPVTTTTLPSMLLLICFSSLLCYNR